MRKHPSHIRTTPHPDGPQRFTELRDIDAFGVDYNDPTKKYVIQYLSEPDERGRFWKLVESTEVDPVATQVRPRDLGPGILPTVTPGEEMWFVISGEGTHPTVGYMEIGDHLYWNGTDFETILDSHMIVTTYDVLKEWKNNSKLRPGLKYLITDFQNVSPIGNADGEFNTGDVEELIVTATSETELSQHAISIQNPQDEIAYDFDDNVISGGTAGYYEEGVNYDTATITPVSATKFNIELPGEQLFSEEFELFLEDFDTGAFAELFYSDYGTSWTYTDLGSNIYEIEILAGDWITGGGSFLNAGMIELSCDVVFLERKGVIKYRKDTVKNIETNYDFRTVKSRFWELDVSGMAWDSGTTYSVDDMVIYNNRLYKCNIAHTNQTPSTTSFAWIAMTTYYPGDYVITSDYGQSFAGDYIYSTSNYQDMPVFSTNAYEYNDDYILGYRNIINGDDYPIMLSSNANGPRIENVDLGELQSSIFYRAGGLYSINIGYGSQNIFSNTSYRTDISYCNRFVTDYIKDFTAKSINTSALYQPSNFIGGEINQMLAAGIDKFEGLDIYRLTIGNNFFTPRNVNITKASNVYMEYADRVNITGDCYNNTFARLQDVDMNGIIRENVCQSGTRIIGRFSNGMSYNEINGNVTANINFMNSNTIDGNLYDVTVTKQMNSNYIDGNFQNCRFGNFSYNGASGNPIQGSFGNLNINLFYGNNSNGGQMIDCVMNQCVGNDFGPSTVELKDNDISNLGDVTFSGTMVMEFNTITSIRNSTFTGGDVRYNMGSLFDQATIGEFNNNSFNEITLTDLSTATIVADDSYSKKIDLNDDGGLTVSWFNSVTGLNYADATT